VRSFGVEEELLLVDARTHRPLSAGQDAVHAAQARRSAEPLVAPDLARSTRTPEAPVHPELTVELQREQIEVVGPPCRTLAEQLTAIRQGRVLADTAARAVRGRVVALATSVFAEPPSLVPEPRYRRIQQHVGLLAVRHLTCGFHVHVEVADRDEGVAVLDRIRVWLPVLLALSANSPFWYGVDSGSASYRYQAMSRWPTAGPCEIFGSAAAYDEQARALLRSGVPLDEDMLYYDARLSAHFPTVEVRVADICMDATHAAVLAAVVRALVETAARQWRVGRPPHPVSAAQLRAWTWRASRFGTRARGRRRGRDAGPAPTGPRRVRRGRRRPGGRDRHPRRRLGHATPAPGLRPQARPRRRGRDRPAGRDATFLRTAGPRTSLGHGVRARRGRVTRGRLTTTVSQDHRRTDESGRPRRSPL
jgi:carboxylate-amine ligase